MPATFVVGRGRWVRTGVAATVGSGVGEGLGDGVSGVTVAVATGVGEGLGTATGGSSRAVRATPAPITRRRVIATPLATFTRNGT